MEKEFVPYEQSIELKELGFNEPCFSYFKNGILSDFLELVTNTEIKNVNNEVDDNIAALTFSQAFRFFRVKYGLYSHVRESYSFNNTLEFVTQINGSYVNHGIYDKPINRFETYEDAELACLKKLIEIVKSK